MTHQLTVAQSPGYIDKRRSHLNDFESRVVIGGDVFIANASGTTTTIVGANAAPATPTNVIRIGDEFKLFTTASVLKEETVFRATAVAVAGSTTITFTPAAAAATASGDKLRLVGISDLISTGNMDRRLLALGFTQAYINSLTENDKMYQIRTSDDPGSL